MSKTSSPGAALARLRWDRDPVRDQPREAGKLGGRPRTEQARCPCDAMTLKRALARGHRCSLSSEQRDRLIALLAR